MEALSEYPLQYTFPGAVNVFLMIGSDHGCDS